MTTYTEIERMMDQFPLFCRYKCTSNNPQLVRSIGDMNKPELEELKDKLEKELETFEQLYEEHKTVDNTLIRMIDQELSEFGKDPKMKKEYKELITLFDLAKNDKSLSYTGRDRTSFQSVKATQIYKKIQRLHQHKIQYTNMFKGFVGDTNMVLKNTVYKKLVAMTPTTVSTTEPKQLSEEEQKILDTKNQLAELDLGDEEW